MVKPNSRIINEQLIQYIIYVKSPSFCTQTDVDDYESQKMRASSTSIPVLYTKLYTFLLLHFLESRVEGLREIFHGRNNAQRLISILEQVFHVY